MYIATQFFLRLNLNWLGKISKTLGNNLPIHAGIPGPASIKTTINYARSCGIGNSFDLYQTSFNLTKLATL